MSDETDKVFDDKLMAMAAAMPAEVSPGRDLWPGIEQAIEQATTAPSHTAWNTVWAQAAAVVLLIAGSSGITYLSVKDDGNSTFPTVVDVDQLFEPVSGEFGTRFTLGNTYLDARDQLEVGLEQKLDALDPTTRLDVVKNLNTIRLAIKDINSSLAQEPDSLLLQELLLSTYHEEMSLMMRVDGIANSVMRREDI